LIDIFPFCISILSLLRCERQPRPTPLALRCSLR
jgi:hypothetical protein